MRIKYWLIFIGLIVQAGCKEKFVVTTDRPSGGLLVVEGFINITGKTDIVLSRSSGLDTPRRIPEPGAQVEIQTAGGIAYSLNEEPDGHYTLDSSSLDPTQQYKLRIRTVNGKEYTSDLTKVNITPPIDSVNWKGSSDAVTVYVSTHDDQVQPGYYQWQFEETWKYVSAYSSELEYDNNGWFTIRPDSNMIYTCWRSARSTNISLANTEKLSSNVIYQYPLTEISYSASDRLVIRYSILVKQYAISKEWYDWSLKVKRNTELIGSIFDAQPSELSGNIHGIADPSETVIGYIGCSTETVKRIFIDRYDIPSGIVFTGYEACQDYGLDKGDALGIAEAFAPGISNTPTHFIYTLGFLTGVAYASSPCVDCRLKGGTTLKPPFWQ